MKLTWKGADARYGLLGLVLLTFSSVSFFGWVYSLEGVLVMSRVLNLYVVSMTYTLIVLVMVMVSWKQQLVDKRGGFWNGEA